MPVSRSPLDPQPTSGTRGMNAVAAPTAAPNLIGANLIPDLSSLFSSSDTADFGPLFQTLLAMGKSQNQNPLAQLLNSGIKL